MKQLLTDAVTTTIIAAAWADDSSFEKIKLETGCGESEVIAIMRRSLKPKGLLFSENEFLVENQNTRNVLNFSPRRSNTFQRIKDNQ